MIHIYDFIQMILFLTQMIFILTTEYIYFLLFNDKKQSIKNLIHKLAYVNILYVKLFQAIALNNKLIDDDINKYLLEFTDNAPWSYSDIDFDLLINISDELNLRFEDGFEKPINSGMISLVYKTYHKESGKPFIVKVKRSGIDDKLEFAINQITILIDFFSYHPLIKNYNIKKSLDMCIDSILDQTNFILEVENMNLIKKNCQNLNYVYIPYADKLITELYNDIIVMDFIEGKKINQLDESEYVDYAELIIKFGFTTAFIHGITHGDLHPGNILFLKKKNCKKKIGILDFGIINKIDKTVRESIMNIAPELFDAKPDLIAEKILYSGLIEPRTNIDLLKPNDKQEVIDIIRESIVNTVHHGKGNQIQIYSFLDKLNQLLSNKNISYLGLGPSKEFINLQMSIGMSHGITMTLCKDNYMVFVNNVLTKLFHFDLLEDLDSSTDYSSDSTLPT